jgi:hypothetical protein
MVLYLLASYKILFDLMNGQFLGPFYLLAKFNLKELRQYEYQVENDF